MNSLITKKHLLPTLALACLAPLASQNAQAAATFSSYATVTYTINNITNLTNAGDFSGLGIAGSFDLAPGQDISTIIGNGSVNSTLVGTGTTFLTPAIGSSYSRTFQLDATANNGAIVDVNYLAWFGLAFENTATDSYDVGLTLSYELSANASGDDAFTDITFNYSNEDGSFSGAEWIGTATPDSGSAYLQNSNVLNFTLAAGGSETVYVDAGITGKLEASPVPVPSALWLFASALLAIPGIKKYKKTA